MGLPRTLKIPPHRLVAVRRWPRSTPPRSLLPNHPHAIRPLKSLFVEGTPENPPDIATNLPYLTSLLEGTSINDGCEFRPGGIPNLRHPKRTIGVASRPGGHIRRWWSIIRFARPPLDPGRRAFVSRGGTAKPPGRGLLLRILRPIIDFVVKPGEFPRLSRNQTGRGSHDDWPCLMLLSLALFDTSETEQLEIDPTVVHPAILLASPHP